MARRLLRDMVEPITKPRDTTIMDACTRSDFDALAATRGDYCVTCYLPTSPAGDQVNAGPIRLKNLLTQAEEQLVAQGLRAPVAREFLADAWALLGKIPFWRDQEAGLALFIDAAQTAAFRLPIAFPERLAVGRRRLLTPLLDWVTQNARFFVLCVSRNRARLLRGDRDALVDLDVPEIPGNLADALEHDAPERSLHAHTGQTHLHGKAGLVFHGQGGAPDAQRHDVDAYLHIIAAAVQDQLQGESAPLVFAGIDALAGGYARANTYPHLLAEHISGNFDHSPRAELHACAWRIIEGQFAAHRQQAIDGYWTASNRGLVGNHLPEIVAAAAAGRVATLLLDPTAIVWGTTDPDGGIRLDDPPRHDSEDLVNLALLHTLDHRGHVESMTHSHLPGGGPAAAIFRYADGDQEAAVSSVERAARQPV